MGIKPIETVYNGYRFRSRLEARWAVFFDTEGIPYEYEPEGIILKDGTWYLPDFYLPWFNCYVEIKPNNTEKVKDASRVAESFPTDESGLLVCVGDPMDNNITLYASAFYYDSDVGQTCFSSWKAEFCEGAWWGTDKNDESSQCHGYTKHTISIVAQVDDGSFGYFYGLKCVDPNTEYNEEYGDALYLCYTRSKLERGKAKARQARFEHGECG